nr:diguanylate cyclase [bacterium]
MKPKKMILAVDDDRAVLTAVRFVLEEEGYEVITAESAPEALRFLDSEVVPALIISDIRMPGLDGFEFCRRVRSLPGNELMPFIFLTGETSVSSRVNGLSSGANAYLVKPFNPVELAATAHATLERHQAYEERAVRDPLTGLLNRRGLAQVLKSEFSRSSRYSRPFSVAMADIDRFKALNDTFGHLAGDRVLAGVAGILAGKTREQDTVGRYGGEEFLILLPESPLDRAVILLERLRSLVAAAYWEV